MTFLQRRRRGGRHLGAAVAFAVLAWVAAAPPPASAFSLQSLLAPRADLWRRWTAHDEASSISVDHHAWTAIIGRYRAEGDDGIARFAYADVTADDRRQLADYLDRLAAVPVGRLARAEQFAYWVNLYNALTVRVVLDHRPVASIRDIDLGPGPLASGPWSADLITVEGETLSLNDIEHRILRPIWADPRVHYVVNCASLGCPDLPAQALTAADGERVLEAAARAYVNHPRGARVSADGLVVSSIYVWFEADFGGDPRGVIDHLRRYAEPALADRLAGVTEIAGHDYDWRLNDIARR